MNFPRMFSDRAKSLRRIAVVVDGLERDTADALLERLPAEQEREIRDCIIELEAIHSDEREAASREFYLRLMDEMGVAPSKENGDADLHENVADDSERFVDRIATDVSGKVVAGVGAVAGLAAGAGAAMGLRQDHGTETTEQYLECGVGDAVEDLHAADGNAVEKSEQYESLGAHVPGDLLPLRAVVESLSLESLATVIKNEQPQTIALVMAAMTPEEAATFIAGWPQAEQGEILRRIAKMDRTDPIVVQTVREELLRQLNQFADERARGAEGRERVQAIVAAAQGSAKDDLLGGLADADRELFRQVALAAGRSGGAMGTPHVQPDEFDPHLAAVAFDRFVDLSDAGLETVFEELEPDVAMLALAGASQPCLSDVLERLPPHMSEDLRRRMESIGPLRLGDIQRAQLMAVAASHHLLSGAGADSSTTSHLKLTA